MQGRGAAEGQSGVVKGDAAALPAGDGAGGGKAGDARHTGEWCFFYMYGNMPHSPPFPPGQMKQ